MNNQKVIYIEQNRCSDMRGESSRLYLKEDLDDFSCDEIFLSRSRKDVIRGMHFQPFPYGQKKLITVLEGAIEGVVLDLDEQSETYGRKETVQIDETSEYSVLIPEYCAWGFHALKEKNILLYNISGKYNKEFDLGIRWDSIGYDWKTNKPVMNQRDQQFITLNEYFERKVQKGF